MRGLSPQTSTRPRSGAKLASPNAKGSAQAHASVSGAESAAGANDTAQWTIEQNKQLLLSLKQENKELKLELSRRNAPARDTGKSLADKAAEKLEKSVHGLRRQYDKIMQEKKTALSRLSNLQDSVRELAKAAGLTQAQGPRPGGRDSLSGGSNMGGIGGGGVPGAGGTTPLVSREVRQLENRLDKAMLKANEAQSIRATYEQVLEKISQEQTSFNARSRAAEESLKVAGNEYDKLLITSKEAQHAKEQIKQELAAFEEKLRSHRQRWERQLEEQRTHAQLLQQTNTNLLHRQYPPLAPSPSSPAQQDGDGGDSRTQAQGQGQQGSAQVSSAAQAVRALCQKTGCASVQELLSSLLAQQESHENLVAMQRAAQEQLSELEGDMALARSHLEELQGGGRLTTQSQLDSAQMELREATARAEDARQLHEQVLRTHADVCSGLDHLASMVAVLPAPPGLPPLATVSGQGNPEQVLEMLAHCEQRLLAAHKCIQGLPKAVQMLEDMSSNPDLSFAASGAAVPMQKLP